MYNMKSIVQIKFGSHLYGTSTPESDLDIKGVYIPCADDILLQHVNPMISKSREKSFGEKNTADDVDEEYYSLQRYLELLSQGQTVALDMLFAPETAMMSEPDPIWLDIQNIAPKLITKGATAFVRYCRQQANKYGIKGSRVSAARLALDVLKQGEEKYGSNEKLSLMHEKLIIIEKDNEFIHFINGKKSDGDSLIYFEVCNKKTPMTASIKTARGIAQQLMDEYGQRALAAERNEGVDWKALSHAVRVGHEAIELFESGKITFPRPEAEHLLKIKQGKLQYSDVAEEIENLLVKVESAATASNLPDTVPPSIIDNFVAKYYKKQIISS
jgi:hypothetical protein